jgi:ubiquinone/menaquinone biosynthesis C-methylase UbiE
MSSTTVAADFEAIKGRQQATWSSGDYSVIGTTLQIVGETLCEAVDIAAGERVLDVAAGNGNASLAAARRGGIVVASDYVPELLELTKSRAIAEGLEIETREADAEALPFAADSFDVVLSTFGVMFTPNQEQAAAELVRVTRPGGRVGLANWTPDGFVGEMFKIVGRYVPPPAGIRSPLQWGVDARLEELFGAGVQHLITHTRQFVFRYRSAQEWLDTFRSYYGPMHKAFMALDAEQQKAFEADLLGLANHWNVSTNGTLRVLSDYREIIAVVAD